MDGVMYKKRTISHIIESTSAHFPVLLLTGPRQVGKTTVLQSMAPQKYNYVTLDDMTERNLAQSDPELFLQRHTPPLIIDEVQYAPELFSQIKIAVDKTKSPGMYWLTGSQKFHLMKNITETLAGRIAILDLLGLSQAEMDNRPNEIMPFLPTAKWLDNAKKSNPSTLNLNSLYERIWNGSYPKVLLSEGAPRDIFYNSYIQTYISRDVRALTKVGNENLFHQFLRAVAARTGQLVNYNQLANELDIDNKTVKSWISILETSGLVYILQPYYNNVTKRIVKTPKLYFLDTGLCAYLTQWSSPGSLEAGAMSGEILETYVISEIIKTYWHNGLTPNIYFYRDRDQKEIDLIIERDNCLFPIEIKKTANPSNRMTKHFSVLPKLNKEMGPGAIICLKQIDVPITREVIAMPVSYL